MGGLGDVAGVLAGPFPLEQEPMAVVLPSAVLVHETPRRDGAEIRHIPRALQQVTVGNALRLVESGVAYFW